MTQFIFVTGGVVSSLGKGLTSASIGLLLERCGFKIAIQKLDPYINVDPGTMSPFQHGEVYVTDDGTEADLDLGHYERFTQSPIGKNSNYTTGKIYSSVIRKERNGDYLGQTVQVIPHIINEIKDAMLSNVSAELDFSIVEVGGTVGDIESLPFLEAIRQMRYDLGRDRVFYIHLTLLPYLRTSGEIKTKPTQHSVGRLREIGIIPDMLICRSERAISTAIKEKISMFCNVDARSVIEERDVDFSIYEVPLVLRREGVVDLICNHFKVDHSRLDLTDWERMLENIKNPEREVDIALVGKYIELDDSYKSIYESLAHAAAAHRVKLNIHKFNSEDFEREDGAVNALGAVSGILVAPGFGHRGIEGKIKAVQLAREQGIPFLGICLGMQCAVIEFTRNVLQLEGANSTEFDRDCEDPVICLLEEQRSTTVKGATMRLGAFSATVIPGTRIGEVYKEETISERHRHRYEVNNKYKEQMEQAGMVCSIVNKDRDLIECVELQDHPWFIGVQFHPEFKSKPTKPAPLFSGFIGAVKDHALGATTPAKTNVN